MAVGESVTQMNQTALQNLINRAIKRTIIFENAHKASDDAENFIKLASKTAYLINIQGGLTEKVDIEERLTNLEKESVDEQDRKTERTIAKVLDQFSKNPQVLSDDKALT